MSGINERVRNFLNDISNDNNVENNLQDLKVSFSSVSLRELTNIAKSSPLNILFDCLNSSNKEQILLTCEVLKLILPALPVTQLITQNLGSLIRALGHPMTEVKVVILEQLIRAVGSDALANAIDRDPTVLSSVGLCLCHEDVSVGNRAMEFFTSLGKTKSLTALCQPEFIRELIENVGENNVYLLRVFDVLVEISSSSGETLKYLENEGLLDRLITFLRTDDILAMLALVEVCSKMAITPHGQDFLERHGIIKFLAGELVSFEDNPLSSLTYPGLSRFFGKLGQFHPSIFVDYSEVLQCAFNAIDSDNLNIFIPSLELIAMVAYSPEGKVVLQKHDEKYMRHVMGKLFTAMTKLPSEWRVRGLHALANIIHVETEYITPELTRLNEAWFNQLGSSALGFLIQMAYQPFSDIKAAALLVILNMANQKWGQYKIAEFPGMLDFLLDRRTESEAEGFQMKYDILKSIVDSKTGECGFDSREYQSIVEYVRQGPFYAPSTTEVAIEGAE